MEIINVELAHNVITQLDKPAIHIQVISYNTKGVIHLLACPCRKGYVGKKIKRTQRIAEHKSTIKCKKEIYQVAAHLMEMNHAVFSLFKFENYEKYEN